MPLPGVPHDASHHGKYKKIPAPESTVMRVIMYYFNLHIHGASFLRLPLSISF